MCSEGILNGGSTGVEFEGFLDFELIWTTVA